MGGEDAERDWMANGLPMALLMASFEKGKAGPGRGRAVRPAKHETVPTGSGGGDRDARLKAEMRRDITPESRRKVCAQK